MIKKEIVQAANGQVILHVPELANDIAVKIKRRG